MAERVLTVRLVGDAGSVTKAMLDTGEAGGKLEGKLGGVSTKALVAGAAIGAGIGAAGKTLQSFGSQFDDAFDSIAVGTGKTGPALDGLKDDFREIFTSIPTDAKSAADALAFVNSRFGATGEAAVGTAEDFLELSRVTGTDLKGNMSAAADLLGQFNISAEESGDPLNMLFRASQQSGVGFASLAADAAGAATTLKPLGFSFEQTTALVGSLGKAGLSTSDVLPALGKALGAAAKDGKSAEKLLNETFSRIKNAGSDTAAASVALDVFGAKAGPKLAGLIREGKLGYDELLAGIQGGDQTIRGAAESTNDWAEKLTMFKNDVMLKLEGPATKVFSSIGGAALSAGPAIGAFTSAGTIAAAKTVAGWAASGASATLGAAKVVAGWAASGAAAVAHAAAGFALTIAGWVAAGAQAAVSGAIIVAHWVAQAATAVASAAVIAAQWVIAFWPVAAIVAAVVGAGILIVKNWDTIKAAAGAVASFVTDKFNGVVDFFKGVPGKISGLAKGMWDGIKNAFRDAVNFIIRGWNRIEFKIPGFKVGPIGYGGFTLGLPNIPTLHSGGTTTSSGFVNMRPDEEIVYLPGGASVVPLSGRGAGGDTHIHFHGPVYGADSDELADKVRSSLLRKRGRTVDLGLS